MKYIYSNSILLYTVIYLVAPHRKGEKGFTDV